ncbi:response regulator transcription factor [Pelagimonas varians]|uniref:Response regulator UvrY n=1 Tax=Pelagimonas varians TaxID=696760 RepID=A0A238L7W5_9RHOB|nr:response regulator transcription factor [Pelagimonas varians]PYG25096.1 LuxR family two component transcriptional regulator [Pelagimonas varians]SMX50406.1 Response regulator UvrY [Pelagimonas varians]
MKHSNKSKDTRGSLQELGAKILIADDHVLLGDVLTFSLENLGFSVGFVTNYNDALKELNSNAPPDVLLLDKNMPGMAGISSVKQAALTNKNTKVVLLSSSLRSEFVLSCLSAGAWGYISKSMPISDVADALLKILKGNLYLPEEIIQELNISEQKPEYDSLILKEIRVLSFLGEGCSYKCISENLGINISEVKTIIRSTLRKLSAKNRIEAVLIAKEIGVI